MNKNIHSRLERIEKILGAFISQKSFLTIDEAAIYLDFTIAYIYKLTHLGVLPFYRPNGKKIYFKRMELDAWISRHRSQSMDEIQKSKKHP